MFAIEQLHCSPVIMFTEVQTLTMPLPNETRHFPDVLVINTGTQMNSKPELNVLTTTNVLTILLSVVDPKFQKISTVNVSMTPKDHMNVHV